MTPFASHIWCLDHLDGLTHLSCISRLTKMSKMTNTFYILLMWTVKDGRDNLKHAHIEACRCDLEVTVRENEALRNFAVPDGV